MTRSSILSALGLIIVVLGIGVLFKYSSLEFTSFAKHKDKLFGLQSGLTILGILVGGFFAYNRFFAQRLWVRRAAVSTQASVLVSTQTEHQHYLGFSVENKGTLALKNVTFKVTVSDYTDGSCANKNVDVSNLIKVPVVDAGMEQVIDRDETVQHHLLRQVSVAVNSSIYEVFATDEIGNKWVDSIAVANLLPKN
jgi:hypothetical protein